MPDLQTELKKLDSLIFDDEGETITLEEPMTQPTPINVSHATFNYIKNNPGARRIDIANALDKVGCKKSSVLAITSQYVRQGTARVVNRGVFIDQEKYVAVKARKQKPVKVAKVTDKKLQQDIIESVKAQDLPLPQPVVLPPPQPVVAVTHDTLVKAMLARMSILQAREMYDELKKVFSA